MNLLKTYLERVGFTKAPKTDLETLSELHRLHTLTFPFENLTPYTHNEVPLSYEAVHEKFVVNGRGGYCFEQNLLFASVLEEIGFKLRRLGGRVLWNQDDSLITRRSHMLLLVKLDETEYLADVGFGGLTLTTPIRFEIGVAQTTTHEDFRIERVGEDLKLQAKVNDLWKTLYRFDLTQHYGIDYEVANYYLYTHPESIFRKNLIVAKPVADGRIALSNNQLTYYALNGEAQKKVLGDPGAIKSTLKDVFGIRFEESDLLDRKLEEICRKEI